MADDTVKVTMIGTGDGSKVEPGTVVTSGLSANMQVGLIRPVVALAVRFVHLYLTTFVGLLTAAGVGAETFAVDATFQQVVAASALSSLIVSGVGTLKDLVTVFGNLEHKYPLATGSI